VDKADIFIDYRHGSANQDGSIFRRVDVADVEINFVENINYCHTNDVAEF
jgi:hypothetical protein